MEQTLEALRASEERFRQIVEIANEGIWTVDAQGFTTFINPRLQQILGYSLEEMQGKPGIDFVYEEDREHVRNNLQRRRDGFADSYEARFLHKDGTPVWTQVASSPLLDKHGMYAGSLGLLTDISVRKQTEEKLRTTQARLRLTVDVAGLGIIQIDYHTNTAFLSPEAAAMFELSAGEEGIPRDAIYAGLLPEDKAEFARRTARCMDPTGDGWFEMESQIVRGDGSVRWLSLRKQVFFETYTRRPDYALLVAADISERKQAEETLRQSKERFELVARVTNDAVWDWNLATNRIQWNEGMTKLFGHGVSGADVSPTWCLDRVHPDDRERVETFFAQVTTGCDEFGSGEYRFQCADGSYRNVSDRGYVLTDANGSPTRVIGAMMDITRRKYVEEVLRHSEERFRTTLDNLMEGCQIVDHDLRHLYVNATLTKHARRSAQELLGHTMMEVYPGIESTDIYTVLRRCMEERTPRQIETEFFHEDRTSTWFQVVIQPIPEGLFILSLDITERKNTEAAIQQMTTILEQRVAERTAALEAANKELEAFSYSVSHDLRAPLRAIDGFSRIVVEEHGKQLPAEAQEYLKDVRANAKQMGMLIDDLLAFSRLSRQAIKPQNVDMTELAHFCFKELNRGNGARHVDFRIHDLPPCPGDAALLKQVWLNLISNALKYSANRNPAIIEVGSSTSTEGTTYFVRDNGVGFNMKYAHKLFGVFQRLHRAEEYEGTGVGLAIVQRIVHRHGGTVHAESIVDTGTTFFFTIPKIADTINGRHNQ
ncbi:MAG: PAS domain S-box protein [Fibrella sp.]|nr:PAS domain S-box protein [Armatimonadota bacterium]